MNRISQRLGFASFVLVPGTTLVEQSVTTGAVNGIRLGATA